MPSDLPIISPDESGDVPRCRAECGSFYTETVDEQEMGWTRCVADPPYDETVAGQACLPRLLRAYAELRELKARRCDGCDRLRDDARCPDVYRNLLPDGNCSEWDPIR